MIEERTTFHARVLYIWPEGRTMFLARIVYVWAEGRTMFIARVYNWSKNVLRFMLVFFMFGPKDVPQV